MSTPILIRKLDDAAKVPTRSHRHDVGWDLYTLKRTVVHPGEVVDIPTGVAIAMEPSWWAKIVGRSSTARRLRLQVIEGVIDAGYRGELFVSVYHQFPEVPPYNPEYAPDPRPCPVTIQKNQRIAQLIFGRVERVRFKEVEELPTSERGESGFGSTGE